MRELGEGSALGVAADNAAADTPQRLVAAAVERFGRLDGALISVGGPPAGTMMQTTDDQWRQAFEGVFLGALRLARTAAEAMGEGGSIALVLSTSVKAPLTNLAISNGLRPGLAMVAKTLADELGPRGIRVNGLMPGSIETERIQELNGLAPDPARRHARMPREQYRCAATGSLTSSAGRPLPCFPRPRRTSAAWRWRSTEASPAPSDQIRVFTAITERGATGRSGRRTRPRRRRATCSSPIIASASGGIGLASPRRAAASDGK